MIRKLTDDGSSPHDDEWRAIVAHLFDNGPRPELRGWEAY